MNFGSSRWCLADDGADDIDPRFPQLGSDPLLLRRIRKVYVGLDTSLLKFCLIKVSYCMDDSYVESRTGFDSTSIVSIDVLFQ